MAATIVTTPQGANGTALHLSTTLGHALSIADRAAVEAITSEGVLTESGTVWRFYDTRPMLSQHEHSAGVIDMHRQVLEYARLRGLIACHADKPHYVRLLREP
jgi:hypothetical protein